MGVDLSEESIGFARTNADLNGIKARFETGDAAAFLRSCDTVILDPPRGGIGGRAIQAILIGVTVSTLALAAMAATVAYRPIPASLMVVYWLLALLWVTGKRFAARWLLLPRRPRGQPVVIYGAGEAGAQLAVSLQSDTCLHPVAYVDEKRALQGTLVQGMPVVAPADLQEVTKRFGVKRVLLAIPTASRGRREEVLRYLESLGMHVQSIPSLDDIVFGGWDIFDENCYEAARTAGVLEPALLDQVRPELERIQPWTAVFDRQYAKRLDGPNVKKGKTKRDLAERRRHQC